MRLPDGIIDDWKEFDKKIIRKARSLFGRGKSVKFTRGSGYSVMGVDPGFTGALAIIGLPEKKIIYTCDMPVLRIEEKNFINANRIRELLVEHDVRKCFIEEGTAMAKPGVKKQGVTSMFRYGKACGIVEGICAGLAISLELIKPSSWKREMLKDQKKGKGSSIVKVSRMYPKLRLTRKKDHGIADALLICLYGVTKDIQNELKLY